MFWELAITAIIFLVMGYGIGLAHSIWKKGRFHKNFKKQLKKEQNKAIEEQKEIDEKLLLEFKQRYQEQIKQMMFDSAPKPSSDDFFH